MLRNRIESRADEVIKEMQEAVYEHTHAPMDQLADIGTWGELRDILVQFGIYCVQEEEF